MQPSSCGSLLYCSKPPLAAINSYREGQKVMGRTGHALGILSPGSPEDLHHRFFWCVRWGCCESVEPNGGVDLLPPSSQFQHYRWALASMHTYPPNDATLLRLLGGKDPKTIHKYMWPYIASLAELENFVVSWLLLLILFQSTSTHISLPPAID